MNKILIKLYVPLLEEKYEVWIPLNKQISSVITLLVKAVYEFSGGYYQPLNIPELYNKFSGEKYNLDSVVVDTDIRNGAELILL